MSKIVLLDSGNLQFRSIFNFRNNPKIPAPFTFMAMIIGYLKRLNIDINDRVVLCQDYGSWRKLEDPSYKAQREGKREELEQKDWWQRRFDEFNELYETLNKYSNWNLMKVFNAESDDLIAVGCRYYKDNPITVISSDKDLEQLCYYQWVKIFSPISKKFKDIKAPIKVLMDKINNGDVSDNILGKPTSEIEWEIRKKIVNLLELPDYIEKIIKKEYENLTPKNLYIEKIPFRTIRERLNKLYEEGKNE